MKILFAKACALLATIPAVAWSVTVPNADTPSFYLVSSSTSSENLLPVRMNTGGSGTVSLQGSGAPAEFYFYQGQLTVYNPNGNSSPYRPLVNSALSSTGCQTFGALVLVQGSSSNKCARYTSFQIQSNNQNSQLGAELVFNYAGGFYSCNNGQEIYYKVSSADGPSGCQAVRLWTVPVA